MPHLRKAQEGVQVSDRPVQDGKEQNGNGGEDHVEGGCADVIHHALAAVAAVELVVEEHEAEGDVLVEGVLDQAGQAVG